MAKDRIDFVEKTYVSLPTITGPRRLLHTERYNSFPSRTVSGWPERMSFTPLLAWKNTVLRTYDPVKDRYGRITHYSTVPEPTWATPDFKRVRAEAVNKTIEAFKQGKISMAVTIAERKECIDMIGTRLTQAYQVLRHVRKGRMDKAIKLLNGGREPRSKKAAAMQLEWSYGWSPLVSDIYTLCDRDFPPDPEVLVSKQVSRPYYHRNDTNSDSTVVEGNMRSTCSILAKMTHPGVASASKLGLINPATVAWELVPFSFVIDWFLPIGDYLDSHLAFAGYNIKENCISENFFGSISCIGKENAGVTGVIESRSRYTKNRISFSLYPQNPLSARRALNALSLIRVLRKD